MSWTFEGIEYHSVQELERARAVSALRHARAEMDVLQRQADRHAARTRQIEAQLRGVRDNLDEINRLNCQLQSETAELRRTQTQMAAAQERFERQAEASFRELRDHAIAAQQDIAALEAAHREHVAEVRQMFDQTRNELAAGLAEAEARRKAGEERLEAEIAAVDRKFEEEKAARLARAQSKGEQAAGLAAYIRERLTKLTGRQEELALQGRVLDLGEGVEDVAQSLARGDTETALSIATSTYSRLRGSEKEAERRGAELVADRLWITETANHLREQLTDPAVKEYFSGECVDILAQLDVLTNRLPATHDCWDRKHAREAVNDHLRELEDEVRHAVAAAPMTRDLDLARESRIDTVISRLERAFGKFGESRRAEVLDGDPKGEAVLRVSFEGAEGVDVHFPLDGSEPIRVEGYGHHTRSGCQQSAVVVSQVLADLMALTPPEVDTVPRPGPQLTLRPQQAAWEGMSGRLAALRSKL